MISTRDNQGRITSVNQLGENNPMYGKRLSAEHRRKIGEAGLGRKHSKKAKKKMSLARRKHKKGCLCFVCKTKRGEMSGKNSPFYRKALSQETKNKMSRYHTGRHRKQDNCNWKGGITPEDSLLRGTNKYYTWTLAVKRRDDWTCQQCGQVGSGVHAHHILSFIACPALRFDIDNGITLCNSCHCKLHHQERKEFLKRA